MIRRFRRTKGPRNIGTDAHHRELVNRLRLHPGVGVWDTHDVGGGFPDIVVGFRHRTFLFELKGAKGKLTDDEKRWHARWQGHAKIVQTGSVDLDLDLILEEIGFTTGGAP